MLGNSNYLVILIGAIPTTAMLAAIASGSGNPAVVSYIAVGAGLMIVWNSAPSRMGWLISEELWAGTLELNLMSRSPFMLTLFGKSLAVTIFNTLGGLIAFGTVLIVSQDLIEVSNLALIPGSLFFAMLAIISAGFVFAPLFILVGGRGGFFNAIAPFGVVCGGFLYPIGILPVGLEVVARCLPTSWAMSGMIHTVQGTGSNWSIVEDWAVSLGLTIVWLWLTHYGFKKVESRVKVTGVLSTY